MINFINLLVEEVSEKVNKGDIDIYYGKLF